MKYCSQCGNSVALRIPEGDDRLRHICTHCRYIHYQNPRLVVCAIPCLDNRVLLCRRAIEPRYGFWTLPGGFMENDETTHNAARRETREEACAEVGIGRLYSLYNLPFINQVHLFYLATLDEPAFAAGDESLEVALMTEAEIPWGSLAFPAVEDTLRHYFRELPDGHFSMHVADVELGEDNRRIIRQHQ